MRNLLLPTRQPIVTFLGPNTPSASVVSWNFQVYYGYRLDFTIKASAYSSTGNQMLSITPIFDGRDIGVAIEGAWMGVNHANRHTPWPVMMGYSYHTQPGIRNLSLSFNTPTVSDSNDFCECRVVDWPPELVMPL